MIDDDPTDDDATRPWTPRELPLAVVLWPVVATATAVLLAWRLARKAMGALR